MRSNRLEELISAAGLTSGHRVYRAPGRVNIVGEHTDYTGGLVLPFACDLETVAAVQPADEMRFTSLDVDDTEWLRYVDGVLQALHENGIAYSAVRGAVCSDTPIGAGLSSSAALEAVLALALTGGVAPPPEVLQRAEHIAVGVPCGLMDQVAVLEGRAGHAIALDCQSGLREHVPLPSTVAFVVIDTGTRRVLRDGRYAKRRAEAEAAVEAAGRSPRELSRSDADRLSDPVLRKRLRHLVTENRRVEQAVAALRTSDAEALGAIVNSSHESLRRDFEVSSVSLDTAVDQARAQPGCLGSRLVGAGFAGCVLAVVRPPLAEAFMTAFETCYRVEAVAGACEISG